MWRRTQLPSLPAHVGEGNSCHQVYSHMSYKANIPYVAHLKFLPLVVCAISSIIAQLELLGIYIGTGDEG